MKENKKFDELGFELLKPKIEKCLKKKMRMQRHSSILLIASNEECSQKFSQVELESHFSRTFISFDACGIEDSISKLWGVTICALKKQCLAHTTCSNGIVCRKTCLLACKKKSRKSLTPRDEITFKRKVALVLAAYFC